MNPRQWTLLALTLFLVISCTGKEAVRPSSRSIDVIQCRMASTGEYVGIRLRVVGADSFDPYATDIYLLDEATGEKFFIVRLQRIGRLAEFTVPGEDNVHSILFRNRDGKLKAGKHVTLVVGSNKVEHLLIQK